ncbi:glycoside hydrolase family 31 protein [Pedococcus sp. P5_B7]
MTSSTTLLTHRPHGIEHPYATSLDQRIPVQPEAGQSVLLGVVAHPSVVSVTCEWRDTTGEVVRLPLSPRRADAASAAALAGGEGHLAEAQAASLGGDGGWAVQSPSVDDEAGYSYRFTATTGDDPTTRGDLPTGTGDGLGATTDWFEVRPARWTATVPDGLEATLSGGGRRLVEDSVEWLVTATGLQRARFALSLAPGDHVVGFGERFDHLDQLGRRLDAVVFEQYKSQGTHGRTYLPMPFAHIVGADGSAWGFHLRTSRRSWYDVGASAPDQLRVELEVGGGRVAQVNLGIYDGSPIEVLSAFLDEAGRAEELPDWVFRLWASGNEWNTQDLVLARMETHRELDIPVGAVVIEAWSDEEGIMIPRDATYDVRADGTPFAATDFTYPAEGAWPDPKAMVDALHDRDIKVLFWQIPLLKTARSEAGLHDQVLAEGSAMVDGGHAVREADGTAYLNRGWWFPQALMPDLSTQRTRDWWTAKRDYLVEGLGVDGFKTDGGEHAWGHDLEYADGRRGDEGNNLYPVHYAKAFGDLLRKHGKAPVTFSRSGFTGSQAHGVFWAGDEDSTWEAFGNSITAGLTAASCGIVYWGWDLAGFSGPVPDAELYLRAAGASTFMPIMQYHSEFNHHQLPLRDRTPWHVGEQTHDDRVVPVFRRFAHLRERLVAYLAAQAAITVDTDRPLMRPLFFDHPADPRVWQHPRQWMLGADLLVNPVTEAGPDSWATYLPEGSWVDVWTGDAVSSGEVVRPVPLDIVPVYALAEAWSSGLSVIFEG